MRGKSAGENLQRLLATKHKAQLNQTLEMKVTKIVADVFSTSNLKRSFSMKNVQNL